MLVGKDLKPFVRITKISVFFFLGHPIGRALDFGVADKMKCPQQEKRKVYSSMSSCIAS